jgi:sugar phosphate isomerase/epimerase
MKIIASCAPWKNDLDHALSRLSALGFREADLTVIDSWGLISSRALINDCAAEAERVRGLLARHGLTAVSVNTAFAPDLHDRSTAAGNASRTAHVAAVARFMQLLGIRIGAHYPGHIADWKGDPAGVWHDTLASLADVQSTMARFPDQVLAPELHYKTPFEQPVAARRLIQQLPDLRYTYEPSHFVVQGLDWRDTADLLDGATHVHLRGCAPNRLQAPPELCEELIGWVVDRLLARNYEGYLSIEYLPNADFDVEAAICGVRDRIARG